MGGDSASPASLFGGLGRGGVLNLAGAVCQQACLLGTTAAIAGFLGQDALGSYALAYAVLSLVSLLSLFGFRAALTRFVAVHLADAEPARVRALIRFALLISTGMSVCFGAALAVFASPSPTSSMIPGCPVRSWSSEPPSPRSRSATSRWPRSRGGAPSERSRSSGGSTSRSCDSG